MIPKTAFIAISLAMAVSAAFGWTMHKTFTEARKHHDEPEPLDKHTCDTCKYWRVKTTDDPCYDCIFNELDRWEEA